MTARTLRISLFVFLHIRETERSRTGTSTGIWQTVRTQAGLLEELQKYIGKRQHSGLQQVVRRKCFKVVASSFPEYEEWINNILPRFVDLIVPFRSFYYYNPLQQGSASLKKVLPAVTGVSYDGMPIAKGDDASLAYMEIAFGDIDDERRRELRKNLLDYCGLDTKEMALITGRLHQMLFNE